MSKKKRNGLTAMEEEYLLAYGNIPSDPDALAEYVKEKYPVNPRTLDKLMKRIEDLEWKTVEFVLYLIPTPTPRPRYDGNHFYVKGAATNKKLIKKYISKHIISTRCEIRINAYLPTPVGSMNNTEIYLAEKGLIAPVGTADVDNLMKTYLDMIQGHLLLNDNLVTLGQLEKFYSIKPRLLISICYQNGYDSPFNERRVTHTKIFKDTMQF